MCQVRRMTDSISDLSAAAEAAAVPWSYDLSTRARTDPTYQRWLAHLHICNATRLDPTRPPDPLGPPPPQPSNLDPRMVERDLAALADYSCRPLHDFAALRPHRGADRDRPVPPQ